MLLMMYSCTGRRLEDVTENRHKDKRNPHPLCSISVGFDFCGIASLVVLSALRKRPCSVGCWARTGDCDGINIICDCECTMLYRIWGYGM